jgi:hypothetical protein
MNWALHGGCGERRESNLKFSWQLKPSLNYLVAYEIRSNPGVQRVRLWYGLI